MKKEEILPIGSIVEIKGVNHQILIIGRALVSDVGFEKVYNDYSGCFYPQGIIDNNLFYFNNEDIVKVVYYPPKSYFEDLLKKDIIKASKEYQMFKKEENEEW